jgi:hypothetical protein
MSEESAKNGQVPNNHPKHCSNLEFWNIHFNKTYLGKQEQWSSFLPLCNFALLQGHYHNV